MKTKPTAPAGHTPGPWHWQGTRGNPKLYAYLDSPSGHPVTACCDGLGLKPEDARLVAAAPELLEALKDVLEALNVAFNAEENSFGVHHNAAEDARSKAEEIIARATEATP